MEMYLDIPLPRNVPSKYLQHLCQPFLLSPSLPLTHPLLLPLLLPLPLLLLPSVLPPLPLLLPLLPPEFLLPQTHIWQYLLLPITISILILMLLISAPAVVWP
ncbi:hypothetical protein GBAR_LOCUS23004 [Geodia barretti]|uniref:Uncharacterized protein n=1 Tax=Geodia barretti TaxID=519541 RepID=A0AA35T5K0_GEOBA|nr:hypothetical protein GBAR_LOCUS23004 [Geodia barretti]